MISDGLGASYSHQYTYDGAKAHFLGRGGLGFRAMTHVDADANVKTKTFFKQDFPHTGLTEIVEIDRNSVDRGVVKHLPADVSRLQRAAFILFDLDFLDSYKGNRRGLGIAV